jgi:hypothetical protein
MATTQTTQARELGLCLAEALRDDPVVKSIWVRPVRDVVQLWIETECIDPPTERRLFSVARIIDERFPRTYFEYFLANPRFYEPGTQMVGQVIPRAAELIYRRDD